MNSAHIHLALSHAPIFGSLTGLFILAAGMYTRKNLISITALILFVATALAAIPVFITGEDAGEIIRNLPGVTDSAREAHEELAEKAIWLMGMLGALSAAALFAYIKIKDKFNLACKIILVLALLTCGFMIKVGNSGGQIRHTEISSPPIRQNFE